jgi:hypothetical protein
MIHKEVCNSRHFRIFWHAKNVLDWEAFDNYDRAVATALQLARPHEVFSIQSFSSSGESRACRPGFTPKMNLQISS